MAYETNAETNSKIFVRTSTDHAFEEQLFGKLARQIAVETRLLQKDIQAKPGAQAFKQICQQLDAVVISLLDAKCFDDTTCIHVSSSIA